MRFAALLIAGALVFTGCTAEDDKPTPEPPTASTSTAPTPSADDVAAIDRRVRAAIESGDTSVLRAVLREAGTLAGRRAAVEKDQDAVRVDAESRLNYQVADWWRGQYADDRDLSEVYEDGELRSFKAISLSSSALSQLATLTDRVQDDWNDKTGKKLSFNDTYEAAFEQELPDQ